MPTLMFQHQFADAVASGAKRQTIRPPRKRPIKVGDAISLRKWEGAAYRSRQVELAKGTCSEVAEIEIAPGYIKINGEFLGSAGKYAPFAWADGFSGITEMVKWFEETHGLPFRGVLIKWERKEPNHARRIIPGRGT